MSGYPRSNLISSGGCHWTLAALIYNAAVYVHNEFNFIAYPMRVFFTVFSSIYYYVEAFFENLPLHSPSSAGRVLCGVQFGRRLARRSSRPGRSGRHCPGHPAGCVRHLHLLTQGQGGDCAQRRKNKGFSGGFEG